MKLLGLPLLPINRRGCSRELAVKRCAGSNKNPWILCTTWNNTVKMDWNQRFLMHSRASRRGGPTKKPGAKRAGSGLKNAWAGQRLVVGRPPITISIGQAIYADFLIFWPSPCQPLAWGIGFQLDSLKIICNMYKIWLLEFQSPQKKAVRVRCRKKKPFHCVFVHE